MTTVRSREEFLAYARALARALAPRSSATVVALSGELGAGKTTFVQEIARTFGVEENVTSPTFVIEKVYELAGQPFERLIHIDAYRLKSEHELAALGWHELLAEPGTLILLEWPERVPGLVPNDAVRLRFEIEGEGRIITSNGEESGEKDGEKSGS